MVAALRVAHELAERAAADEIHREEVAAVVRAARLVDRGDVRMRETRERFRLAPEHAERGVVDVLAAADDLQRDAAVRALLLGLVDDPHSALAELPHDAVRTDRL